MKSGRKHHVNKMVSTIGRFYEEINTFRLSVTPIVTADARMLAISFLSIENVTRACGDRACVYLSSVTRCEMKISYRDSDAALYGRKWAICLRRGEKAKTVNEDSNVVFTPTGQRLYRWMLYHSQNSHKSSIFEQNRFKM